MVNKISVVVVGEISSMVVIDNGIQLQLRRTSRLGFVSFLVQL